VLVWVLPDDLVGLGLDLVAEAEGAALDLGLGAELDLVVAELVLVAELDLVAEFAGAVIVGAWVACFVAETQVAWHPNWHEHLHLNRHEHLHLNRCEH
jgi:hypothetical protein